MYNIKYIAFIFYRVKNSIFVFFHNKTTFFILRYKIPGWKSKGGTKSLLHIDKVAFRSSNSFN